MSQSFKGLFGFLVLLCFVTAVSGTAIHDHHRSFAWENFPGFYGVFGFVSVTILVLVSKYMLRPTVMRRDQREPNP